MSFNYFEWVTEGLLIFIIGVIGFFGNGLSVWTFWRQRVHRIFHNLLLSLAIFDMVRINIQFYKYIFTLTNLALHLLTLKCLLICTLMPYPCSHFTLISNLVTDYIQKRRGEPCLFSFEYNLLPKLITT